MRKPLFGKRETIKRFRGTGAQGGRRSPVAYFRYAGRDQATEQLHRRIDAPERTDSRSGTFAGDDRPPASHQSGDRTASVDRRSTSFATGAKPEEAEATGAGTDRKQETANRWGKLNKLIGSADGTKFKVIAQSYTLNLLLMHANKHLSYLSKRYRLQQVPGTLALQVIDCDMCDEVRTVYSLSGGESFLISLALALGLSSLSSNNLKVESLFIDEGFGSLDADSLRTVMEALEQLQMQGRKIGVISHVQEMSERIAVQVQLHRAANGKSAITLTN